jgi:hypothetical protein
MGLAPATPWPKMGWLGHPIFGQATPLSLFSFLFFFSYFFSSSFFFKKKKINGKMAKMTSF